MLYDALFTYLGNKSNTDVSMCNNHGMNRNRVNNSRIIL